MEASQPPWELSGRGLGPGLQAVQTVILLPELKPPVVSHTLPDTWVLSTLEQGSFGVVGRESRWALTCLLPSTASAFGATGQQAPPPTAGIRSERSQRGAVEATLVVAPYLSQAR